MTVWDFIAACRRRWPVLIVGLVLTAGSLVIIDREPGVYWAQSDLIFLAPTSSRFPNSLNTASESLIMTASVIERDVNLGDDLKATSSANVSLVDDGVRDGVMVRLPNLGGQWANNYSQPVLDIQAVAGTPDEVNLRMNSIKSEIEAALQRVQDNALVDAANRIKIQASPDAIDVKYVRGNRPRAVGVAVVLGMAITIAAVVMSDRKRLQLRGWYANRGRHSAQDEVDPPGSSTSSPRETPNQARSTGVRRQTTLRTSEASPGITSTAVQGI